MLCVTALDYGNTEWTEHYTICLLYNNSKGYMTYNVAWSGMVQSVASEQFELPQHSVWYNDLITGYIHLLTIFTKIIHFIVQYQDFNIFSS